MTTVLLVAVTAAGLLYIVWELHRIAAERKEWAAISREIDEFYRERADRRQPAASPGSSADRAAAS